MIQQSVYSLFLLNAIAAGQDDHLPTYQESQLVTIDLNLMNNFFDHPLPTANHSATDIIEWAHRTFGDGLVLQSSFGIRSAAFIHMVVRVVPDIPVVLIDTGYLPQETLDFANELQQTLNLNLKIYRPSISVEEMEGTYGNLYEIQEDWAHELYGKLRKVEPMERALKELKATAVLTGLQASQTDFRKSMRVVNPTQGHHYKIAPLLNWQKFMLEEYLDENNLPYHPLKAQGYESVGDVHSSRPMTAADADERSTRFSGFRTECGLHTQM